MTHSRRGFLHRVCAASAAAAASVGRAQDAARSLEPSRATVLVGDAVLRASIPDQFFSFNLDAISLDRDYWDTRSGAPVAEIGAAMRAFAGAFYRYPGGNISNHFAWEWAVGDPGRRKQQRGVDWLPPGPARFGPREYFEFVAAVGGRSWYTLNLVGWSETDIGVELPSDVVALSNGRLARLRVQHDRAGGDRRYYHLGNELDRNRYRWPAAKYIERCRETIDAVREADPQARFVAFLRDFDVQAGSGSATPKGIDHAAEVLGGLPAIEDVSLQVYYDQPAGEGARWDLNWRWRLIDTFLRELPRRTGRTPRVWISEHARAMDVRARQRSREGRLATTSGMTGAIASADFCIAALQRPEIMATFWHALAGGVWWDLFNPARGRVTPTPAYHVFRLLKENAVGEVLRVQTRPHSVAAYAGGYDVSSAVLRGPVADHYTVWVANRAGATLNLDLVIPALKGQPLRHRTQAVAAAPETADSGSDLHCVSSKGETVSDRADAEGRFAVALPARCVAVVHVESSGARS